MKTFTTAAAVLLMSSSIAAADPAHGTWQTQPDEGSVAHVQMGPCGSAICGKIVRTYKDGAEYQSPNKGKTIVMDMKPQGGGAYEGKVYRPANKKVYLGKMQINGDTMALRGCVAGGLICKKQTWKRVN